MICITQLITGQESQKDDQGVEDDLKGSKKPPYRIYGRGQMVRWVGYSAKKFLTKNNDFLGALPTDGAVTLNDGEHIVFVPISNENGKVEEE